MLWSLIKILVFVALIALLAFGAGFLMESGDVIRVAIMSREFTLTPLAAVIAALALLVAVWLGLKLLGLVVAVLKFVNGDETAVSRFFDRNRERRGFEALAEGMMALASGEGRLAMAKAAKAERYLGRPDLTNLLTAQAAEMSGDRRKALEVYKRLLGDDRTRFVAVRGLMKQKLEDGDTETALKLAEKAFALKPRHAETQDTLFGLQARKGDWHGARATLAAKLKAHGLPRDVHTRRDAVLAIAEADAKMEAGETEAAKKAILQANRHAPGLVPAATAAARLKIAEGSKRQAVKIIRKAWDAGPHPDLAAAFAEIEPDESRAARMKRFEVLTRAKPSHPESRMLAAELALAAEDFPAARRALGDLPETHPTQRALTLMAAIERGAGTSDAVVRGWLARAISAPRGPQWICSACNHIHAAWTPACENCGAVDTLDWAEPPQPDTETPVQAGMLPLIVGALETAEDAGVAEAATADAPAEPSEEAAAAVGEEAAEATVEADAAPAAEVGEPPAPELSGTKTTDTDEAERKTKN
jgi:HemY protein